MRLRTQIDNDISLLAPHPTARIVNILIGLGLPWMVAALSGSPTRVPGHETLQVAAYFLSGGVAMNVLVILAPLLCSGANKATLSRARGWVLLGGYLAAAGGFCVYLIATHRIGQSS